MKLGNCFLHIKNETLLSPQQNPFKTSAQINGRRNLSENWNKIFLVISSSRVQLSDVLQLMKILDHNLSNWQSGTMVPVVPVVPQSENYYFSDGG